MKTTIIQIMKLMLSFISLAFMIGSCRGNRQENCINALTGKVLVSRSLHWQTVQNEYANATYSNNGQLMYLHKDGYAKVIGNTLYRKDKSDSFAIAGTPGMTRLGTWKCRRDYIALHLKETAYGSRQPRDDRNKTDAIKAWPRVIASSPCLIFGDDTLVTCTLLDHDSFLRLAARPRARPVKE